MRPVTAQALRRAAALSDASLLRLQWRPAPPPAQPAPAVSHWAWIGPDDTDAIDDPFAARGITRTTHSDVAALCAALAAGAATPDVVVLAEPATPDGTDRAAAAHLAVHRALAAVQDWSADDRLARTRLTVLTQDAVAAAPGAAPDPALAAVWGLIRSGQAEHPGRVTLVDLDGTAASRAALPAAVDSAHSQLAVRDGTLLTPHLTRLSARPGDAPAWRTDGTVLVTGGLGTLGRLLVRHLVATHGLRRLTVVARSGEAGAAEFLREMRAQGAELHVVAGDAGDRDVLAGALASIPADRPLTAVVHLAGTLDDGVLSAQTPERVDRVLRPKADAAWHLHELTARTGVPLVAYSSVSSVLGPAGQAAYAAANAFVDALVTRRHATGTPGLALGWGLWSARSGLTGDLADTDVRRITRTGIKPLSSDQGLALFDLARTTGEPVVLPLPLDATTLHDSTTDDVPPLLRTLARTPVRRTTADTAEAPGEDSLAERLGRLSVPEQDELLLDLVRGHVAAVLGYDDPRTVGERRPFTDIGFDSLRALQLRNRLGGATGLRLSATLVFDYPTPLALGQQLRALLVPDAGDEHAPPPRPDATRERPGADEAALARLGSASREEVFDLIDDMLAE
nr:beta-ketoacyl reductase [Streptomyces sp. NRRL B-1347]